MAGANPRHIAMPARASHGAAIGGRTERLEMLVLDPRFVQRPRQRRFRQLRSSRQRQCADIGDQFETRLLPRADYARDGRLPITDGSNGQDQGVGFQLSILQLGALTPFWRRSVWQVRAELRYRLIDGAWVGRGHLLPCISVKII